MCPGAMGRGAETMGLHTWSSACILIICIDWLPHVIWDATNAMIRGPGRYGDSQGTCAVEEIRSERSSAAAPRTSALSNCPVSCDDFYVYMLDATSLGVEAAALGKK